jgi:signal transduction histidine kinase
MLSRLTQTNIKRIFFLIFLFTSFTQNIIAYNQNNTELLDSLIFKAQNISDSSKTKALELLNNAFNILSKDENQKDKLEYFLKIGEKFSVLNNKNRALEILNNGLELSHLYSDSIKIWEFNDAIGLQYHKNADYTKSIDHFIDALCIAELIQDTIKIAKSYDRIAIILKEQEEYNKALEYLNKSLELKTKIKDKKGELSTRVTIADINATLKNYVTAISIYEKSESLAIQLSMPKELSRIYSNMGNCYLLMKNYSKAEYFFLKGIKTKEKIGDKYCLAIAYNNLSIFYKRISKFDAAYAAAYKSLNLSKEASAAYVEMSCYLNLSHYFKLNKNFEKAYDFQRKYAHLKDSLFNDKKSKQLTEIREKYEAEKKEQQIEFLEIENKTQEALIRKNRIIRNTVSVSGLLFLLLFVVSMYAYKQKQKANKILSDKNIKINEQNIELDKLNKTKNKLFSIIAHDLRSPLSSIEGVSELISKLLEQDKKDQILKLSKHIDQSVSNVNILLDNLLNWALSQIKRLHVQFEKLDIHEVINHSLKIQGTIAESKDVELKTSAVDGLYVMADLNLLRVILRNLLSNAIKFTPSGGKVEVNAIRVGDMIQINAIDTGIGMDSDTLKQIFDINLEKSKEGTKGEKGSGLGLVLCKEFIEINKGEIKIESKLQSGTRVSFTLPS